MRKELLLSALFVFFLIQNISAQCPPPGFPIPGNTCPEAPVLCNDINGYCTTINSNNIVQPFPGCPSNVLNNDEWFAFFAGTTTISLQITPSNCQGTYGQFGLQAAIYDGCGGNTMASQCSCSTVPFTLTSTNYVVGQVYWVVIDGCAGDICDYVVNVLAGSTVPTPPGNPGPISGMTQVCPGAVLPYFLNAVTGATQYNWTLVPPIGTVSANNNLATINWNLPGTAQLCVTVENPCISNPAPSCITVTSEPIPPTDEEHNLCLGKSVICAGQVFFTPGVFPVTLTSYLGCDSIVNCIIIPIPPITNNLGEVDMCGPNTYEICGTFYNQSGIYSGVCTSYQGCDSTVIVDLAIMEPEAIVVDPPPVIGCGSNSTVTLDGSGSSVNLVPNGITNFLWTGPGIVGPDDDVLVTVELSGQYCLEVTHERNGVSCTDQYCVEVEEDTQVPDSPILDGETDVCDGDIENYTVTPVGGVSPTGYSWTTPNGEPFNQINNTTISIDWSGSSGGDLCVTADNDCGPSDPTCISITVGTAPEDPDLVGDDSACDGDVLIYSISNPTDDATCTWTVPPGASFIDNGTSIEVDFDGATTGDVCVSCENSCGVSSETCITVVITNVPDVPFFTSSPSPVCDGNVETYCVNPDPNAVDYTWDTPLGTFSNESDCLDIDWTGLTGGSVCVTANNDCGASEQTCFEVEVNESPTADLGGGGEYCEGSGETVDITVDLTGISPWTLTYTDGTDTLTKSNITDTPDTISVDTAGAYTLIDVQDASDCPGQVSGQADVIENPLPTVQLTGNGSICEGSGGTVNLNIDLTGTPNWTVNWTVNGNTQAALNNITSSPYTLTIGQSQAGDVELTDVTDGNGCVNGGDGNVINITVNDAPTVSNISTTCNATNTGYTLTFEINGGDPASYSVTPNIIGYGGSISAGPPYIFTSNEILSGDGYSYEVNDGNDCNPVTVEDNAVLCDCTTMTGDMDLTTIEQCGNDPVTAPYDSSNEVLDADDAVEFVLHEGSGVIIVNQIATNSSPTFGFQGGMTYGTAYYISAIVGNDNGSGGVNQSDPCLAVAQGTPVIFHEVPTAFMIGDVAICEGDMTGLSVEFTGNGPFNLQYTENTDTVQINGINANPFILDVNPSVSTVYTLISVNDVNCPGEVQGDITVTVNTAVAILNPQTDCNATSTAYTLSFEITGGDSGSYSVTGVTGTITATPPFIFTSDPISTGTGYSVTTDDANSCDPQSLSENIVVCDCVTDVGEMDPAVIDECGDGPVTANYDGLNQSLDGDDVVQFVLHTGILSLGTIIQINNTDPTFSYDPNTMNYGTTYYISAIVGNDDGNGNVDPDEPCFAFAQGTPVTFFEVPSGTLSGDASICEGDDTDLTVDLTGDSPWFITINGDSITDIVSTPFNYNVNPLSTTIYTLESLDDDNCPGGFSGQATVTVNVAPTVNNLMVECNGTNTAYTVSFEIEEGDNSCYTVNGNPGTLAGNVFTSDEIPSGNGYLIQVDDCHDCGPIIAEDPLVICDCQTLAGDMEGLGQGICGIGPVTAFYQGGHVLDADDVVCFILHEGDPDAPLASNPDEPSFQFQPANMVYGQTYFICAVAGNDNGSGCVALNDPCRSVSAVCTEVVFHEIPSASLIGDAVICAGETVNLTVTFTGGVAPYTIVYGDAFLGSQVEEITMDNPFNFTLNPTKSTVISLDSLADANCVGNATGNFPITVNDPPDIQNLGTFCNDTNTAYTVTFTINSSAPGVTVDPPGSGMVTPAPPYIFTSNEIPTTMGYFFEMDNENGCGPVPVTDGPPVCDCITDAGSMDQGLQTACETDPISSAHNSDEVLDGDDVLGFMLHEQAGGLYTDALATNNIPTFSFDPGTMSTSVTYFICPVAGNDNGAGDPDPNDPCFITGPCTPVFWYPTPTIDISGTTTICEGQSTDVTLTMTGVGPFSIDYLENGNPQTLLVFGNDTVLTYTPTATVDINFVAITSIVSPNIQCPNTANDNVTINVSTNVNSGTAGMPIAICEGDNQNIDLDAMLSGADAGGEWKDQNGVTIGNIFNTLGRPSGTYDFTYTVFAQAPCSNASTNVQVIINPLPIADAGTDQELNCDITTGVLGGPNTSPGDFTYEWTGGNVNNSGAANTTTTEAGTYTLTVTNNLTGCSSSDSMVITIDQSTPEPTLTFSDLSCFGADDGFISLEPITGGAPPYVCSINGGPFNSQTTFTNLSAGEYTIICRDSKGCEVEIPITIIQPNELDVELTGNIEGDDNYIQLGDSVQITVQVNMPFDSLDAVIWSPSVPCDTCESFYITPSEQLTLSITVQEGQCSDSDDLTVFVRKDRPVFIPNVFSPNGDNTNDKLIIFGGKSVAKINTFMIFNRWGETVYEYHDFLPNDPAAGWDGKHRGKVLDPAVFVWFAEVEFIDGLVELYEGDVALVK